MTQFNSATAPTGGYGPDQLADLQSQAARLSAQRSPAQGLPTPVIAGVTQLTIQDGMMTSSSHVAKVGQTTHAKAYEAGFIPLPNGDKVRVEDAKSGGLIPHTWKEGDVLPFDQAPAASAVKNGADQQDKAGQATPDATDPSDTTHAEHLVKLASGILQGVDQVHGPHIADALMDEVAHTGDLESIADRLPDGVSDTHVKQVMAGYTAQAEDMLSKAGASIAMLQEVLTDDELRQARRATLINAPEEMIRLGKLAVDRLAQMPTNDPETFLQMVTDMDPKTRDMIRHDRSSGEWIVTVPGRPEMSYGAAVRLGIVKV
jgi:hypothetical protein